MVAAPEPEIAAKNMPASTETTDRPPLIMPSRDSQNSTSTFEILPPARRSPAKMKNGTAISEKESQLANMRCTTIIIFASPKPANIVTAAAEQIEKAIGTPSTSSRMNTPKRMAAISS